LLFGVDDNRDICRSICSTSAFAAWIIDRPSVIQPRATPTAHHRGRLLRSIRNLRGYTDSDAEATLTVFLRAIRETAAGDSPDQVAAWAAEHGDLAAWAAARAAAHTQVAIIDGRVVGFTDLDDDGYVDMLSWIPTLDDRGRDLDAGCNHRPRPTAPDGCFDNLRQFDSQAALRAAWLRSYRGAALPQPTLRRVRLTPHPSTTEPDPTLAIAGRPRGAPEEGRPAARRSRWLVGPGRRNDLSPVGIRSAAPGLVV
jgi:hypothetical protein